MNVLIYTGSGTASKSGERTAAMLRSILQGRFDVVPVGSDVLSHEDSPWQATTALLVFSEDKDAFGEMLGDRGIRAIRDWVQAGGKYLGFGEGASFACRKIQRGIDESASRQHHIVSAVAYISPKPAATQLKILFTHGFIVKDLQLATSSPLHFGFDKETENMKVLATYGAEPAGLIFSGKPAIVQSSFGKGTVLLCGPRICDPSEADSSAAYPVLGTLLQQLSAINDPPLSHFKNDVGSSQFILVSSEGFRHGSWVKNFISNHGGQSGGRIVVDSVNSFNFVNVADDNFDSPDLPDSEECFVSVFYSEDNSWEALSKSGVPLKFNLETYFSHLESDRNISGLHAICCDFGSDVLYSPSTTSTQTILEKNYKLSQHVPSGLVCIASHQSSGRGRGANSWISQEGCLQFSMTLHHKDPKSAVFIQYLFGLAVVDGIRTCEGYENIPLRLKWPNDIYCFSCEGDEKVLKKIGGVLVNSSYQNGFFNIVIGCGLNVANRKPTLSINDLIMQHNIEFSDRSPLPPLTLERVLSRVLVTFEKMYGTFSQQSQFAFEPFLELYYSYWLHSDQYVYLKDQKVQARIVGVDASGLLKAEGIETGALYLLQPDGNSFDMMKGLISKKYSTGKEIEVENKSDPQNDRRPEAVTEIDVL
ncbi:biotin holocarboxylase synthetase [Entophlyctis luteolus]|nr:biotin holocarboxylase synthetase [Entophlyctis luteolus]